MGYSTYAPDQQHRIATRGAGRASFITPYLRPGMTLLDVGCGPGSITIELAKVVAPGSVVGVDIDSPAIEQARNSAAEKGVTNVSFQVGDATGLSFPDDSFDAASAASTFQWLKEPAQTAREVFRVLKPGGVFAARDRARDGDIFGNLSPAIVKALRIYDRFSLHRGANHRFGSRLYETLLHAGFADVATAGSYDDAGRYAGYFVSPLVDPKQSAEIIHLGLADAKTLASLAEAWKAWSEHPHSFMLIARCEAVGWKPGTP